MSALLLVLSLFRLAQTPVADPPRKLPLPEKLVVLTFDDTTVRCVPTENVLLANGLWRRAMDITSEDDINEKWIHKNSGVVRRVEV